jgi:hypothetical protein
LFITLTLVATALMIDGCSSLPTQHPPDAVEETLPAPTDRVRQAVLDVLTAGGYNVEEDSNGNLKTGYREEITGLWDWMLRWRFGVGKSRVEATLTPVQETSTRLTLHVMYESKDGLFTSWEDSPTALPQSATNQLRLIKNKLQLL